MTRVTFEEFVASRGRDLWRSAFLLTGDAHKAEDLVQTVLMKCWRRWSSNGTASTAVGVLTANGDERERDLVTDEPAIRDPYTTAPCPEVSENWANAPIAELDAVVAVRYCGRPFSGFPASTGPDDALVVDLPAFVPACPSTARMAPTGPPPCRGRSGYLPRRFVCRRATPEPP